MAEYIEREKAIAICQSYYEYCLKMHDFSGDSIAYDIRSNIQGLPIADVVEVVRCKDCKHYNKEFHFKDEGWCVNNLYTAKDEHFCSYGERKEAN